MHRWLAVTVLLSAAVSTSSALECYACRANKKIEGITLAADITNRLASYPTCEMMEKDGPGDKYKQKCLASDKGCVNIVDPKDSSNRLRSCFPLGRDECQKSACYCMGDLCNGSAASVASVFGMVTALVAVLAGR